MLCVLFPLLASSAALKQSTTWPVILKVCLSARFLTTSFYHLNYSIGRHTGTQQEHIFHHSVNVCYELLM